MSAPVHVQGHRSRLRERYLKSGFSGFAEHEVVELLLTLCIPRRDVKIQAKTLLKQFGSLRNILDAPVEKLQEVEGMGSVAPVALHIIRDAATLYLQESAQVEPVLNSTSRLETFWRSRLGGLEHEVFEVAYLDKSYRLLPDGVERLQTGDVDRISVFPRQVLAAALKRGAVHIVLAHNHPGGQAHPSEADIQLTEALCAVAQPLDIKIVDHIIATASQCFSFRREGLVSAR